MGTRNTEVAANKRLGRTAVINTRKYSSLLACSARPRNSLGRGWNASLPAPVDGTGHPCFVFHESLGFGVEFASVREAYDKLSLEDGWLILLRDGSAGIHRPEARWDDEKLIVG